MHIQPEFSVRSVLGELNDASRDVTDEEEHPADRI
jgi:hypothetical protein